MENSNYHAIHFQHESQYISVSCFSLCFIMIVVLGFLPIVPNGIVKLLKPVFLILCVFVSGRGYYRIGFEKWLIILLIYLFIIWIVNLQVEKRINPYASMLLFALFYLCASLKIWNRAELRLIFNAVVFSCAVYSIVVLVSNHGLFRAGGSQHISYFSMTVNRNSSAFAVVPGAVASLMILFYGRNNGFLRTLYGTAFLVCIYTVVALACRSAFLAATTGVFLVVWQVTRENANQSQRIIRRTAFILFVLIVLFISISVLDGTNSARLFDYSSTGRDDLWESAWKLIKEKPIFGGGFGYWERSGQVMSPHNTFLNIMMISGYIGGCILGMLMLSLLFECLRVGNIIALAFAMELVFHSISEAGLDYYAYIPLVLTTVLLRYSEYQKRDISSIFNEL